ncbi:hypothetical protein PL321_18110 [Caloramator sp. mosi_1]|uniref:hypothetical protein n=1 Tax=Caloramator sp. mosi_1 TaxID=3023090 RepID=UPI00236252A3|nr:hypothetical protein [Caloramator sp. mosi_1]WDC84148.1 hypothetical protein PL321_18110 [Caloramator sp. mosi_1]
MDYSLIERKDIPSEYKWDIDTIYSSEESLLKDVEVLRGMIEEIKKFREALKKVQSFYTSV